MDLSQRTEFCQYITTLFFWKYLLATIWKNYPFDANLDTFVDSMYVLVCPKKFWTQQWSSDYRNLSRNIARNTTSKEISTKFLPDLSQKCQKAIIFKVFTLAVKSHTVFTQKSAYARKGASLELAPPFWCEIFNEHLPRMSTPPFSWKRCSFEKYYLKGVLIWEVHKKIL